MSEEILKALMQFFAILAKQGDEDDENFINKRNYVEQFLLNQLSKEMVAQYLDFFDSKAKAKKKRGVASESKMTSVGDSVRILGICKKINKTLTQKQKVVVLVRLFEFLKHDEEFTPERMQIIETAAEVFNLSEEEYRNIHRFALYDDESPLANDAFLLVHPSKETLGDEFNVIVRPSMDRPLLILKVLSVGVYFVRYFGDQAVKLNNRPMNKNGFYLFAEGSIITPVLGQPIYFSDVVSIYLSQEQDLQLSFVADNILYKFPKGNIGIQPMSISEGAGKLVGIMGGSGAGKSTLLNVLSGIESPSEGSVRINGIDIHKNRNKIEGVIGFVPQDDLLIEELTVYQNLFYNAKLCFKNLSDFQIKKKVINVIDSLGLTKAKDLKVGNPLDKIISGGQRKRLNIGLELIREPSVLFLDEPTSGLSSKDSVNVVDLLRQLALKGKLIFVVIHQPSSEIYKMFDKMIFLDQGGYLTYYGNPVQAISYFKTVDNQADSEYGDCHTCGTVNSETIFEIMESKIVNDFGELTENRKISPQQWNEYYKENFDVQLEKEISTPPEKALYIPGKIKQWLIFSTRDILSKIANKQYLLITFLEAPALAFILSFIIRKSNESGEYIYAANENIPSYLFMSIVVALFLGLTVSAEEIFRDQKILKRERFLNLSRNSYLLSKVGILMIVSAIQSASFVLVGNSILEIKGMFFEYFSTLFTISVLANIIGLNISSSFNSAVTIYIIIPLLIIPQMILGGAMFSFNKLNKVIGGGEGNKVPIVAEFIPARWAYEGLMVDEFMNNAYGKEFFDLDEQISVAHFKQAYVVPFIKEKMAKLRFYLIAPSPSQKNDFKNNLVILRNVITDLNSKLKKIRFEKFELLTPEKFDSDAAEILDEYILKLQSFYSALFMKLNKQKEALTKKTYYGLTYNEFKDEYVNEYMEKILKNSFNSSTYEIKNDQMIQIKDPVYLEPEKSSSIGIGAHFYAPHKFLFGHKIETPLFNIIVLFIMSIIGFIILYFDGLKKAILLFSKIGNVRIKS